MKKSHLTAFLLTLLVLSICSVSIVNFSRAQTGTQVGGVFTANTIWTKASSPYTVVNPILVDENITLTIEPGVIVNLNSFYIRVAGTLKAEGTSTDKITFIRENHSTPSGSGIQFINTSSDWNETEKTGCIISNAVITYENTIDILESSPKISECNIFDSGNGYPYAILVRDGEAIIVNNSISSRYAGIGIGNPNSPNANIIIANNTIFSCQVGIEVNLASPLIEGNLIVNNMGSYVDGCGGIRIATIEANPILQNNTVILNSAGLNFLADANATIRYNNIQNNTYNTYLYYPTQTGNINATYNWWGTTNTQTINQTIYDFKNDFNLGKVTFIPYLNTPNTYAPTFVNATANAGGSISSSGITKLNYGDSQTFTITANNGYHIVDVLVNGSSVGAVSSYTIYDITGATTILAAFAPNPTPTPSPSPTPTPTATPITTPTQAPTPTPTINPSPAPTSSPVIITATTEAGETINLQITGNITAEQISNLEIQTNQSSSAVILSFTVTGQNGTTGFGNVTIPKSSIPNGLIPIIYLDNQRLENQGYTQDNNNFYAWYTTHFSTHEVSIVFSNPVEPPYEFPVLLVSATVIIVAVSLSVILLVRKWKVGK